MARPSSSRGYSGKLADPEVRKQRARKARAAQDTLEYHIRKIVECAPPLTQDQRDKLAVLLRGDAA